MEKICVAVRVRPSSADEESVNGFNWKVESNRISLHRSHGTPVSGVSFAFDHVFEQECSNATVYELLTKDIIHAAVDGFNGTAFAYGQTSSGKTFTMNGSENDPGIIHRAVKDVFAKIQMTSDREFLIRVSYMEIYNEDLIDLFTVDNQKLQVHESLERGVFVAGLKEEIVSSADQVLNLIQLGEVNRHFGETNMNARSSRSHTVFRMIIESKRKDSDSSSSFSADDVVRVSVLNLVDLAGSERIAKTGAGGVRLKEGKHINKSLMVLGNVINKLSEGGKQRAHIPYRDSKLTRILQPALGGNAKTSIICTVAPEEVHIEETKGTLQFASRAKRITNCVQVNEILTDAALLKRQKQEIELLRRKLEGSHAEELEQEILKMRNVMLKYEFEREKLATELEEERRSHKERDQLIKEQQMKISNSSNLVTLSDFSRSSSQNGDKESQDGSIKSHMMCQEDAFSTPSFKAGSNVFVAKRPQYSTELENSPFPDAFSEFADEDTWMQMNKGYIADLDSLHMTPARNVQSFPTSEDSLMENNNQGNQNLNIQLKQVLEERDELKRKYDQQVAFSNQLTTEISELHQEMLRIQEIPQSLLLNLTNCKNIYKDVISSIENFIPDKKSASAQILATTSEVGACLFSSLESHLSVAVDGKKTFRVNEDSICDQCNKLCKSLNSTISSLVLSDASELKDADSIHSSKTKSGIFNITKGNLGEEIASWKDTLENEMQKVKQKYNDLEKESNINKQLLEVLESKYQSLEGELCLLKEERDALNQKFAQINGQKEKALKDMSIEAQKRRNLEDEIKQFSVAFACRQRSIMSFHSDFKSIIDTMKAHNPTILSKSLGS